MNENSLPCLRLLSDSYSLCKASEEFDISSVSDQIFCTIKESGVTTLIYKQNQNIVDHFLEISHGWNALRIEAKLDFSQSGILYSIISPLSKAKISILVISTFDTDYIFFKEKDSEKALSTLRFAGYQII